jgi:hypothetical protein
MGLECYLENIKSLEEVYGSFAEKIKEKNKNPEKSIQVMVEKTSKGEKIFKVAKNNRILYINGKYNLDFYIENWFKSQKKMMAESAIFVMGFGNGRQIKYLLEKTENKNVILVYEPSIEIFLKAMEEEDLTEIFKSKKVLLAVEGVNENELKLLLKRAFVLGNSKLIHHLVLENYQMLFPEKLTWFIRLQKERAKEVRLTYNTFLRYTKITSLNAMDNLPFLLDNYTTFQLLNILPKGVPAIIVAAGPSLNKNIGELKKAVGRACIIAVDTALKPLLNNGVIPDFLVTVDGEKSPVLFEHERFFQNCNGSFCVCFQRANPDASREKILFLEWFSV